MGFIQLVSGRWSVINTRIDFCYDYDHTVLGKSRGNMIASSYKNELSISFSFFPFFDCSGPAINSRINRNNNIPHPIGDQ